MKRKLIVFAAAAFSAVMVAGVITACGPGGGPVSYSNGLTFESSEDGYVVTGLGQDIQVEDANGKKITVNSNQAADYGYEPITDVVIPTTYEGRAVVGIAEGAFSGHNEITSVSISESVVTIGAHAFSAYNKSVLDENGLPAFDDDGNPITTFLGACTGLTEIVIPNSVTTIGDSAFEGLNLTSVTLGSGITELGVNVFADCKLLSEVTVTEGCAVIGEQMFTGCTSLAEIELAEGVLSIGAKAFYGCNALGRTAGENAPIILPAGILSIGESAFENTGYYDVGSELNGTSNWQNGVLYIGNYLVAARAETDISGTKTPVSGVYTVAEGTITIADGAFADCRLLTGISLPASLEAVGQKTFLSCNNLESIAVDGANANYTVTDNCLIETATDTLVYGCKNSVIPATVKAIGDYAFFGCSDLETVTLPEGLVSIGQAAFFGCGKLASVKLPAGLEELKSFAFAQCAKLTEITVPEKITRIGNNVFFDCTALETIVLPAGFEAFEENAFAGCYNLTTIYFGGDAEAWEKVFFLGTENDTNLNGDNVTVYFYSAGAPQGSGNFWHYENDVPAKW